MAFIADIHRYPGFYMAPASVAQLQATASRDWIDGSDSVGHLVRHIHLPVLIGDGAEDHLAPTVNSRALAKYIPHAQLHVYPDAAHGFWFQDAHDWVRRIDRFYADRARYRRCVWLAAKYVFDFTHPPLDDLQELGRSGVAVGTGPAL